MKGDRLIAETFKAYGVTHVFFEEAILRRSLVEMERLGILRIPAHSEKAAAYMADGYARISRGPGVCMCQSVGAANMAAGLQDAFLGHSPVIAITGKKEAKYQLRNSYQEVLHGPLFQSVTKKSYSVESPEQLGRLISHAFVESTALSPGPVHLDVPGHMGQQADAGDGGEVIVQEDWRRTPRLRIRPEDEYVDKAVEILAAAQKPVLVAGGGAIASVAGEQVLELADRCGLPVACSLNAKGVLQETHPAYLGVAGVYSRWSANEVIEAADLVLFVGSSTNDLLTSDWSLPKPNTPTIQINIDPSELGKNYPCLVSLWGDARETLRMINGKIGSWRVPESWRDFALKKTREWSAEMRPLLESNAVPINPARLCQTVTEALPSDAILVADTGYSSVWTGILVDLRYPGQRYIHAAGSLGWSFPAALGAKCAAPERPVVCFTGDGALWYHLAEMETAARCGISIVTIVNNNSSYAQCEVGVKKAYGERTGNKEELYRHRQTNFARIAEELGCVGQRVEHPDHLAEVLSESLNAKVPVVVDVVTDGRVHPPLRRKGTSTR